MDKKYIEKLGRIIMNTYGIQDQDAARVGKLINTTYQLLEEEYIRDCREEANKAQYDEDWQSNQRDRAIAQNGNIGYEN